MKFFTFIASLFESDKPTSSSRFFAFMMMIVLCFGVTYFFIWCKVPEDHMAVFKYTMVFILLLIGIVKVADLLTLRTGVKVTQTQETTPTGTTASVEKEVTSVQQPDEPAK